MVSVPIIPLFNSGDIIQSGSMMGVVVGTEPHENGLSDTVYFYNPVIPGHLQVSDAAYLNEVSKESAPPEYQAMAEIIRLEEALNSALQRKDQFAIDQLCK